MMEYDQPSAELLGSFKRWADENYGGIRKAFMAIDHDGSGTLSLPELKKACRRMKWTGEVRLLFECLDHEGEKDKPQSKRSLTLKDVAFLDSWEVGITEIPELEEDEPEAEQSLVRQAPGPRTMEVLKRLSMPRPRRKPDLEDSSGSMQSCGSLVRGSMSEGKRLGKIYGLRARAGRSPRKAKTSSTPILPWLGHVLDSDEKRETRHRKCGTAISAKARL